jgi:hypothetical protein
MTKFIAIALATVLLAALLDYGALAPCGIVRAQVRQQGERVGGFGVLAAALPDGVIDSIIAAHYGPLSPGRCIALAFGGAPLQEAPGSAVRSAAHLSISPNRVYKPGTAKYRNT